MDRDLWNWMSAVLDETKLTSVTFLARWKIRRFFEEPAKELKIKLPAAGMSAEETYEAKQKAPAQEEGGKPSVAAAQPTSPSKRTGDGGGVQIEGARGHTM